MTLKGVDEEEVESHLRCDVKVVSDAALVGLSSLLVMCPYSYPL